GFAQRLSTIIKSIFNKDDMFTRKIFNTASGRYSFILRISENEILTWKRDKERKILSEITIKPLIRQCIELLEDYVQVIDGCLKATDTEFIRQSQLLYTRYLDKKNKHKRGPHQKQICNEALECLTNVE